MTRKKRPSWQLAKARRERELAVAELDVLKRQLSNALNCDGKDPVEEATKLRQRAFDLSWENVQMRMGFGLEDDLLARQQFVDKCGERANEVLRTANNPRGLPLVLEPNKRAVTLRSGPLGVVVESLKPGTEHLLKELELVLLAAGFIVTRGESGGAQ